MHGGVNLRLSPTRNDIAVISYSCSGGIEINTFPVYTSSNSIVIRLKYTRVGSMAAAVV